MEYTAKSQILLVRHEKNTSIICDFTWRKALLHSVILGLGVFISFLWGVKQFKIESAIEFKKIYFTKQIEYINTLTEVTSELCNPFIKQNTKDSLIIKFRSLYYGKMEYFLEDKTLQQKIHYFDDIVSHIENNKMKFKNIPTNHAAKETARKIAKLSKKYIDELYKLQH